MARHRKASRTSRSLERVAARTGVAALVATAPVGLAAPAQAATEQAWDRLAECESGGDWDANTGNGYYGGLQFSDRTWDGFGGERFASRADLASREQQIFVAERVLSEQGWDAWPTCSRKIGLV